jgi:Zn-dependent protease
MNTKHFFSESKHASIKVLVITLLQFPFFLVLHPNSIDMKQENEIIKNQRKKVIILRIVFSILCLCLIYNLVLAFAGYRIDYNLLSVFILGFISYKIFLELRIQSMVLTLTRYLLEDVFQKKFDEKMDGDCNS